MKQRSIPLTKSDFENWEREIARNNDTICNCCEGELETEEEIPFSTGIKYECKQCGKKFKKTKYMDFGTGENYFVLEERKE